MSEPNDAHRHARKMEFAAMSHGDLAILAAALDEEVAALREELAGVIAAASFVSSEAESAIDRFYAQLYVHATDDYVEDDAEIENALRHAHETEHEPVGDEEEFTP
ncbi:MAG: hypothetical protein WC211_00690 [Dehalococcoidia bacterium]